MKAHQLSEREIAGRSRPARAGEYPQRWIRLPTRGRCPETGLSRGTFYALISTGKIKSACLRRPGTVRGARFVWLPSVFELLDRAAAHPDREAEAAASRRARAARQGGPR